MLEELKKSLYFPLATYFRFFAEIRLRRWHPKIIVVTGSNGKTTLLHLLEAQIGEKARFSHHANSAYGIPFDILDIHRKTLKYSEWISIFLRAPMAAFTAPPKEKIYVVEADCDRPNEGKFLGSLLRPHIVLWTNVSGTHAMNFDQLVSQPRQSEFAIPRMTMETKSESGFNTVEEAIAYEFGYFLKYCRELAVINGDIPEEAAQAKRTRAKVRIVTRDELERYSVTKEATEFVTGAYKYTFPVLLPEEVFYSVTMCREVLEACGLPFDSEFNHFQSPPGRSSIFKGIKHSTLIDSSYNANLSSIKAVLKMLEKIDAKKKWVVIGDMLELGKSEQQQHEELADLLSSMKLDQILLLGARTSKYTYDRLIAMQQSEGISQHIGIHKFSHPREVLHYLEEHLVHDEVILFKGSQSMKLEGIIAKLLLHPEDQKKLPRQESFWDNWKMQASI